MVLAITPTNEQTYRYVVFIGVSEFQTFLHNADCQLKHLFWLTLCSVKKDAVGCQPVSQFTICSSHCRLPVFKTGAIAVLPADIATFLPCSHSNAHSHHLKNENIENLTRSRERPAFRVVLYGRRAYVHG